MDKIIPAEPQSANQYEGRVTEAVKSVLVEIGQILGSFQGKYAVIGGAVPWLLLDNHEMPHVGTLDVDLGLHAEALGEGEYARLVDALMAHEYKQSEGLRKFQLVRTITPADGSAPINVIVDFLMPRDAVIEKNRPPIIEDFAVQRADGADLALHFNELVAVRGTMPGGGTNQVEIAVCSIPALLAMKGYALNGRLKQKDAYDIYYCVRNYPGGIPSLAQTPYAAIRLERACAIEDVASPDGRGVVIDPEVLAVDGDAGFGARTLGVLSGQVFLLHLGNGRHQAA